MNEDINHKLAVKRGDLLRERRRILSLAPEKALDEILDAPSPAALVHSCSEEDLHFLIHEIGPEDSLPLLFLASTRQWEYILDMEVWERDRMNFDALSRWLDLMFKADPNRLINWFLNEKSELINLYLFKNIELRIREHDEDPSDFGEDFFTLDDTFYIRFIDESAHKQPGSESGEIVRVQREEFLAHFLERLAGLDHVTFQNVLLESSSIISSESEEEAYRLRNVRIAEKGFLPFDEAIQIYQPLMPRDLKKRHEKFIVDDAKAEFFAPVPVYSSGILEEDNFFSSALRQIDSNLVLQQLQTEFAGLCNQMIAADQKTIRDRVELKDIVKKACGYIRIGFEQILKGQKKLNANFAASMMQRYPLFDIFRVGFGAALQLKWKAERWREKSWFVKQQQPLSFWGEEWLGVLGGLLIKKPLYFDNYKTGVIYREFLSTDEIQETDGVLNEIIAFDAMFSLMNLNVENRPDVFLSHKRVILTLWARHCLNLSAVLQPIALDTFKCFFNDLWDKKRRPRKIQRAMKESFLKWLCEQTNLSPPEITDNLGRVLENLFGEIESEYGDVAAADLDPRYVLLFLLK